jgi:hypothetical protein
MGQPEAADSPDGVIVPQRPGVDPEQRSGVDRQQPLSILRPREHLQALPSKMVHYDIDPEFLYIRSTKLSDTTYH